MNSGRSSARLGRTVGEVAELRRELAVIEARLQDHATTLALWTTRVMSQLREQPETLDGLAGLPSESELVELLGELASVRESLGRRESQLREAGLPVRGRQSA